MDDLMKKLKGPRYVAAPVVVGRKTMWQCWDTEKMEWVGEPSKRYFDADSVARKKNTE